MYLPEPSDTWLGFQQTPAMPDVVRFNFIANRRTWTDQRHLPQQNVPELGNLIKARATHKLADPSDTRIVRQLVDALPGTPGSIGLCAPSNELLHILPVNLSVCSHVHRPKL